SLHGALPISGQQRVRSWGRFRHRRCTSILFAICLHVTRGPISWRYIMAAATWVREELDRNSIAFEELHHPDAYTAQEVAQKEHISGHRVAKVVCVMADGKPV